MSWETSLRDPPRTRLLLYNPKIETSNFDDYLVFDVLLLERPDLRLSI